MDVTDKLAAGAGPSEALIEESILPTSLNQRPIGMLGYAWMWVGIAVIIASGAVIVLKGAEPAASSSAGSGPRA